jgi:hypothetical protein
MGMDSEIVCIGAYKKELNKYMPYDNDYDDVPEGTIVETTIMCCHTTDISKQLARCLGVEVGDPTTYPLIKDKISWLGLSMITGAEWEWSDCAGWQALEQLLNHGFLCIFRPNY